MKRTYLIQRLEAPGQWAMLGKKIDNPFSFGGGLKNGGLSNEAMDLIRSIFSFDYMGSAEYEFGAVPKAISKIAQQAQDGELVSHQFEINIKNVPPPWMKKGTPLPKWPNKRTVYVLADKDSIPEIEKVITQDAEKKLALKEPSGLSWALKPTESYHTKSQGWLELNNGFFFFLSEEMWKKTCQLFKVPIKEGIDA